MFSRQEIRFKFWLNPGVVECYHQLVENSSSIYFMYEIMNRHTHEDTITVFFRNSMTGIMLKTSQSADRGHLELSANETGIEIPLNIYSFSDVIISSFN